MIKRTSLLFKLAILIGILSGLLLSGCTAASEEEQPSSSLDEEIKISPLPENIAPDFKLQDLDGETVSLSELRGKIVVLNFWSLGCPYCLQEMPDFDSFNLSKPEDVELFMINLDKDPAKVKTYINNQGYSFRVLKDEGAQTARAYLIRGIPTTFIIGKDGIVKSRISGALTKDDLEALISEFK